MEDNVIMLDNSIEAAAERYELALERTGRLPDDLEEPGFRQ